MLSEYHRALRSYTEQKGKQDYSDDEGSNTPCNGDGDENVTRISIRSTTNNRSQNTNLENEFITELKTCGLKAVKENVLISLFQRIVCFHNDSFESLHSTFHESKELNKTYKSMVNRQESDIRTLKEEKADDLSKIEKLQLECQNLQDDLLNFEKKFEDAQKVFAKEKDVLLKKNRKDMDSFLRQMDSEVETVRSSMKEEAEKMIAEARSAMQKEKDLEIQQLNEMISQIHVENKKNLDCLQNQKNKSSSEFDKLNARIEDGRAKLKDLEGRIKHSDQSLQEKESLIQDLQQLVQKNNECWKEKMNTREKEREEELSMIEEKVRQIVLSKDEKIKVAMERALKAEARQKEVEEFLRNIESGFIELEPA